MKWVFIIFVFYQMHLSAQNLIPNPSFELVDSCSVGGDNIPSFISTMNFYCSNWFDDINTMESTCDYLKENCTHPNFDVPNNIFGQSYPQNGNAYINLSLIGFYQDNPLTEIQREHASVKLTTALLKDSVYCISFYYKNAQALHLEYSSDNIGVLFTYDTLRFDTILFRNADIRTDQGKSLSNAEWEHFSDYYIAKGGEFFFNLGMFGSATESSLYYNEMDNFIPMMYFIDNVSVTLCNKDSLFNVVLELPANVFTPNNDGINEVYIIKHQNITTMDVQIINRWGDVVNQFDGLLKNWEGNNQNGEPLNDGVYFILVNSVDKYGETHKKTKTVTLLRN